MNRVVVKTVPIKNATQVIDELNAMAGVEYVCDTYSNPKLISSDLVLKFEEGKWFFVLPNSTAKVSIDFADIVATHRLKKINLMSELVVKAVQGRKPIAKLDVVDATAGLGRDSFMLAAAGCRVNMIERIPLLAFLLNYALLSAVNSNASGLSMAASRIRCVNANSAELFMSWKGDKPDVIYLDPMYSENNSGRNSGKTSGLKTSAAVKKQTQLLHCLNDIYIRHANVDQCPVVVSNVESNIINVDRALSLATQKVVVKRAPKAEWLDGVKPSSSLMGKSVRFDVYAC